MRKRTLGVVLLAGLAISGGSAFTAANTVPDSAAGIGSGAVSGIVVNDIDYTVTQVAGVDKVSAVGASAAASLVGKEVIVRLKGSSGTLATADTLGTVGNGVCAVVTTRVTCTWTPGTANLVDVTSLEVVAYDNDAT